MAAERAGLLPGADGQTAEAAALTAYRDDVGTAR